MIRSLLLLSLLLSLAGCGGSGSLAPVKGKVVSGGKPVTEGTLTFVPLTESVEAAASPATGEIQADGSFVLGTKKVSDGAAIGKHRVMYAAPAPITEGPAWDGYGKEPPRKFSPFEGFHPKVDEIEIKPGQNDITIELVPGSRAASQ
jgi:hypothetical protein